MELMSMARQVGFSFGEQVNDETGVAQRMRSFMQNFFRRYPALLDLPLFPVKDLELPNWSPGSSRVSPLQA